MPSDDPRRVYERIQRAALDGSADDYADLYAADAVLEFPFAAPGFPRSLHGQEAIRSHLRAAMGRALKIEEFRDVVVHDTTDPEVIVAEHSIVGTATASGRARSRTSSSSPSATATSSTSATTSTSSRPPPRPPRESA